MRHGEAARRREDTGELVRVELQVLAPGLRPDPAAPREHRPGDFLHLGVRGLGSAKLANFCKFLAGSFSAVSKRNFARKYAFDSIFQALQDLHTFAPL